VAQSGGTYDFFGLKISRSTVNKIVLFFLFLLVVIIFWNKIVGLFKSAKTTVTLGRPSDKDYENARKIDDAFRWYNTDEETIVSVVKQYTKETYPLLSTAYFELTGDDLTKEIKADLNSTEIGPIINIIT